MPEPKPSIGRIVHYISVGDEQAMKPGLCMPGDFNRVEISGEYAEEHRAAVITGIHTECWGSGVISLHVMTPAGTYEVSDAEFDPEGKKPGTWHWPERTE